MTTILALIAIFLSYKTQIPTLLILSIVAGSTHFITRFQMNRIYSEEFRKTADKEYAQLWIPNRLKLISIVSRLSIFICFAFAIFRLI